MCGIVGSVGNCPTDNRKILAKLSHRGPDDQGSVNLIIGDENIWLGQTRLSILDLSPAGHQPMQSRDGRWWITFNGEIYNHLDIRKELSGPFKGHSDTETILEGLSLYGIKRTLSKLNGMFAFCAVDTIDGKLYLVRDPFGIKPLYFINFLDTFSFASEVKALRELTDQLGKNDFAIDRQALQQFLTLRYTPSESTLWQGVERLLPGHILCLDLKSQKMSIEPYIVPELNRFSGNLDEAIEEYQHKVFVALKRQLLSDVPVGILLSGGIDSALVAAMAKDAGNKLPCFSVGFGDGHKECELSDAAETAGVLGLPFHQVLVTQEQLRSSLPDIVQSIEEPLGTTSVMPMWHLVKRARQDVTVVLTGQGSDEPWGGYFRYQVELLRRCMPFSTLWSVGAWFYSLFNGKTDSLERGLRTLSVKQPAKQIIEACALFSARDRQMLIGDSDDGGVTAKVDYWLDWLKSKKSLSGVERMMRLDTRMNLADDLLLYGDKISMAVSLETRVPMLDIELVRFIESLPIDYRILWKQGKVVHKKMAERYLPSQIVHRPKKGFQVPFGEWSRNDWRAWLEPLLLDGLDGLLLRDGVEVLWKEHLAQKPDRSRQIFALMMLALWRQEHF